MRTSKRLATETEYRLGGELPVRRLGFGAFRITGVGTGGEPASNESAKLLLRRAVSLGVNLIDTADAYGPAVSEQLIAEALYPYPADLVLATKGGMTRTGSASWKPNGRPGYLRRALDGSLKRLRLERIDLYQLHAPDPEVPFEDSVGALADARKAGKIRHIGLSNVTLEQLTSARSIVPIASVQNRYNLIDRSSEKVLEACERTGIGFIPWCPLHAGALAKSGGELNHAAQELGVTPSQLALAWLLARSPMMLPIPGTGSRAHLEENCGASTVLERWAKENWG
jgi:aryl-alcohol dehydrogenase-like predicted oxidoreductase